MAAKSLGWSSGQDQPTAAIKLHFNSFAVVFTIIKVGCTTAELALLQVQNCNSHIYAAVPFLEAQDIYRLCRHFCVY